MNIIDTIRDAIRQPHPSVKDVQRLIADATAEVSAAALAFDSDPSPANEKRLLAAKQTVELAGVRLQGALARERAQAVKEQEAEIERAERARAVAVEKLDAEIYQIDEAIAEIVELHREARRKIDTLVTLGRRLERSATNLDVKRTFPSSERQLRARVATAIRQCTIDDRTIDAEHVSGMSVADWLSGSSGGIL
jgi:hypothetical protein